MHCYSFKVNKQKRCRLIYSYSCALTLLVPNTMYAENCPSLDRCCGGVLVAGCGSGVSGRGERLGRQPSDADARRFGRSPVLEGTPQFTPYS